MYPRKGAIRVGSDADLVIWDPNYKHTISAKTHHHNIEYNIFEGTEVQGKAITTFSNGRKVWDKGQFHNLHLGRFIERKPLGFVYARHK